MKPKHKWQAFDFRLRVIAESYDREHLFHMLSVLGVRAHKIKRIPA